MILDYPICRVVFHVEKLKRVPSLASRRLHFQFRFPPFFSLYFFFFFFPFPFFFLPGDRNYGRAIQAARKRCSNQPLRSVSRSAGDFRSLIFPRTRAQAGPGHPGSRAPVVIRADTNEWQMNGARRHDEKLITAHHIVVREAFRGV